MMVKSGPPNVEMNTSFPAGVNFSRLALATLAASV